MCAVIQNNENIVSILLQEKNVNVKEITVSETLPNFPIGSTALMFANLEGNLSIVKKLIKKRCFNIHSNL